MDKPADHRAFAETLRRRIVDGPGETEPALRQAVAARAAGGASATAPYDDLARLIGEASYRVTDAQVAKVVAAAGNQRAAFEIVTAAAVGAGLLRWRQAMKALEEAPDAAE